MDTFISPIMLDKFSYYPDNQLDGDMNILMRILEQNVRLDNDSCHHICIRIFQALEEFLVKKSRNSLTTKYFLLFMEIFSQDLRDHVFLFCLALKPLI